jgi:fatty-acyl-CoA synthase
MGVVQGDRVAHRAQYSRATESFYAVPQIGAVLVPANRRRRLIFAS